MRNVLQQSGSVNFNSPKCIADQSILLVQTLHLLYLFRKQSVAIQPWEVRFLCNGVSESVEEEVNVFNPRLASTLSLSLSQRT